MIEKKKQISLREAKTTDAAALLYIYAPYVKDTAITFEYRVPSVEEFEKRIAATLKDYPYIVAEDETGSLLGYAYAGCFHAREAYDWAVETSIYVAQDGRRKGIGRLLHEALEAQLKARGFLNMYACISCPANETDPYVTRNSIDFHAHMGYRLVGTFYSCGYKFDRWYDMVWMEKHIGDHHNTSGLVKPKKEHILLNR